MNNSNYRPLRLSNLLERQFENELVLYDIGKDHLFRLEVVAAAIWDLCDGRHTSDEIANDISSAFQIIREQALRDVQTAINDFQRLGILVNPAPE